MSRDTEADDLVEGLALPRAGLKCPGAASSMYNFASTLNGAAMIHTGRHFLQIPGPTNVPDRVLRAMDAPVIDHRSAEFASLGKEVVEGMRGVFQTVGR